MSEASIFREFTIKPVARYLLIFFGVLDAIILLRFTVPIMKSFAMFAWSIQSFRIGNFPWFSFYLFFYLAIIFIPLSMGFSAYALIRGKKWGLRLNYYQLPLRWLFRDFSFGFLFAFPLLPYLVGHQLVFHTIIILEIARLIATIFIHYQTSKNQGWSSTPSQPPAAMLTQTDQPTA